MSFKYKYILFEKQNVYHDLYLITHIPSHQIDIDLAICLFHGFYVKALI